MKLYLKNLTGIFAIAGLAFSLCVTEAHSRLSHIRERSNQRISAMMDRAAARAPRGHTRALSLGSVRLAGRGAKVSRPAPRPNLPSASDVKAINDLKDTYQDSLKDIHQEKEAELAPIEAEIAEAVEALEEEFGTQIEALNKEIDTLINAKDAALSELRKDFLTDLLTAVKEGNLGDIGDLISGYRSDRKEVSKAFDGEISDIKDNIADAEEAQEKAVEAVKESYAADLKEINDKYDAKADELLAEYKSDVKDYWKDNKFGNQNIPDSVLDPEKKTKLSDLRNIRSFTSSSSGTVPRRAASLPNMRIVRSGISSGAPARNVNFAASSGSSVTPASRNLFSSSSGSSATPANRNLFSSSSGSSATPANRNFISATPSGSSSNIVNSRVSSSGPPSSAYRNLPESISTRSGAGIISLNVSDIPEIQREATPLSPSWTR